MAAPGDTLFIDDFERAALGADWSVNTGGGGDAAISTHTANSGTRSLYTRWSGVTVTSRAIDTSTIAGAELSMWIRIGDDITYNFSEYPDTPGEDLTIEYLNSSANWIILEQLIGGNDPAGEIYNRTYTLPPGALHANFRIRIGQTGGSGSDFDYYHVDDVTLTETAAPPTIAVPFCDNFESGMGNWVITGAGSNAGISSQTANSGSNSLYLRWNTVAVSSNLIDASTAPSAYLSYWLRRGDDSFSENPENNEDLTVEYKNNLGIWITLDTFLGGGTPGEILTQSSLLPANAMHSGLQVRFSLSQGSGADYDYWHLDDVCVGPPPPPPATIATYLLDETTWGSVIDSSGNGNHGTVTGTVTNSSTSPAKPGDPGTCGYADINYNTTAGATDAINTGIDVDSSIGNTGTISFWYKSNVRWNGNNGDRQLFDASRTNKYFFLVLRNNSRVRLGLEDSSDADFTIDTGNNSFAAGTWVHIAATWDLSSNQMEIFLNGNSEASSSISSNGTLGNMDSLYMGDNRSTYFASGSSPNSANGSIDEVRIYDFAQSTSQVQADMNATHPCSSINHYAISYPNGNPGVTCEASLVTVTAHDASHNPVNLSSDTAITITTTPVVDAITSSPVTIPAGSSSANFFITETTATTAPHININVTDGGATETSGSATAADDPALAFAETAFRFVDTTSSAAITIGTQIAGKPSSTTPGIQTIGLQPIRTDTTTGECQPVFVSQTAGVNLGYECNDPTSCTGSNLLSLSSESTYNSGTAVTLPRNDNGFVASYTSVNLAFDASGIAPLSFIYNDAGQITLHATKTLVADGTTTPPITAATLNGSSNPFVTRPFGLDLDFSGQRSADWGDNSALDGSDGDPSYATNATGSVFTTAGSNFPMTIRSVLWEAADDSDFDGIPDDRSNLTGNGVTPNFSGVALDFGFFDQVTSATSSGGTASPSFTAGVATQTMSWPEVGVIDINVTHNNYLGDATADITTTAFDVGRFTPDSFIVTLNNSPSFAETVSGTFTYLGQNFLFGTAPQITIQAVAADGITVTQNYEGSYWKLGAGITPTYTDLAGATDSGGSAVALSAPAAAVGFGDTSNVNGQVTLTLHSGLNFSYARPVDNDTVDPFDADVRLELAALDSDAISGTLTPTAYSLHLGFASDTELGTGNPLSGTSNQTIRLGRALLVDNYARAGTAADLPVTLEYYDAATTSFVANAADAATTFNDSLLSCSDPLGGATIACGDITITPANIGHGGTYTLTPGNNSEGTLNYRLNLAATTFLKFDWDGDGAPDDDPEASVTFGRYRDYHGDERFIYWREVESP